MEKAQPESFFAERRRRTWVSSAGAGVCLLLTLSLTPTPRAAAQGAAETAAGRAQQAAEPERQRLQIDEEGLVRNIWWNQETAILKLGLTEDQRAAMDDLFRSFLAAQKQQQEAAQKSRQGFSEAIEAGRWQEARREVEQMGLASQALATGQPTLKIEVLALLDTEQLSAFDREYAHLYDRPWFRYMAFGSGAKERGARQRNRTMDRRPASTDEEDEGGGGPERR